MDDLAAVVMLIGLAVLVVPVLLIAALVSISRLKQRVAALEFQARQWQQATASRRQTAAPAADVAESPAPSPLATPEPIPAQEEVAAVPPPLQTPVPVPPRMPPPLPVAEAPAIEQPVAARSVAAATPARPAVAMEPSAPTWPELAVRAVRRWFTVGNVPVKIGVLVLFAGVAALLKYASDQGWLRVPVELRLAGIAAAAIAALVFAWRQRERNRAFALSLQGGAIGVLLLVVFAAVKIFGVIPAGAAFALSIVLVAGAGVLAVLQNAKALAVFALLAGFLAPIWLSTGSGNHVALFSYYAVLNAAIVGIAWYKSWRILNLLGFFFTFGIGTAWGVLDYAPQKYASTQPFLVLFFLFYLAIPLLFARRQPAGRRDLIDGCLVFGMPLVVFALQAGLMRADRLSLAFCALGLGVLYAVLAWVLRRRGQFVVLVQAYALLAVGFATLAVPLALSAQATACVFALEGAALVWLGLQQRRLLPQVSGAGLQLAAAAALCIAAFLGTLQMADALGESRMFANARFMSALLIALAGFGSAWAYQARQRKEVALIYYLWALAWWCGDAIFEIGHYLYRDTHPDALLFFVALTGWLAAEVHRRRPATALAVTTLIGLALAIPLALWQSDVHGQPFAEHGVWAWLAYLVLGIRSLLCLRAGEHRLAGAAQFVWWLVWPLVASMLLIELTGRFSDLGHGWLILLAALPWLLLAALSLFRWHWIAMPLGARFDGWRNPLLAAAFLVLGLGWLLSLFVAGGAAPLPWLPVLNPLELGQLTVLVLVLRWLLPQRNSGIPRTSLVVWLSVLAFVWITSVVLHAVHHWGGVAWRGDLVSTSLAQTSLTVVWSVLGVLGWVIGSRRGQRMLWLAGAVLMAVVLAKLVLVDRGNLGNGLGIASFIAYGLLCTVVGYLAPAPPRHKNDAEAEA